MNELANKKCIPCEGGTKPLTEEQAEKFLAEISGWELDGEEIEKDFKFKDFVSALLFINEVGRVAEEEGHHPDVFIHDYNQVKVSFSTYAIKGLSENDFIMAAKTDGIYEDQG